MYYEFDGRRLFSRLALDVMMPFRLPFLVEIFTEIRAIVQPSSQIDSIDSFFVFVLCCVCFLSCFSPLNK